MVTVELVGHLTSAQLNTTLGSVKLSDDTDALLVDCLTMTGYDNEARETFVAWNREHKERLQHVAVVTERPLWRMVISAMSLASGQQLRGFATRDEAVAWLNE
jgi:hypothetical protein